MATSTSNDCQKPSDHATVFADSAALKELLETGSAEAPQGKGPFASQLLEPLVVENTPRSYQVASRPHRHSRLPANDKAFAWPYYVRQTVCVSLVLLAAALFCHGMRASSNAVIPSTSEPSASTANTSPVSHVRGGKSLRSKPIEDVRVGDRIVGYNPIREQADLVEPDPTNWRKLSLHMTKESGHGLWIDLLRPVAWIEEHNARVGTTIHLDLFEMGAVGDAEVTYLGPCPRIHPGTGTIVTGTFKHQADENTNVVRLQLEDQIELTGVTDNHPYWSEDRQDFVEVGQLNIGELVDTAYGLKRVVSVTPIEHNGFLYNLETTEHVYRVGSLGTLVHNTCAGYHHFVLRSLGSKTPYRHRSLTYLNEVEHTRLHRELNDFLRKQTKTLANGKKVDMLPRRGNSGKNIIRRFSSEERITAMSNFYKTYDGGKYHQHFLNELKVATQHGWFK